MGKSLGHGAYANVRLCIDRRMRKKFAMKIYEKHKLADPLKRKAVQREITVLKKLDHLSIIKLYEMIDTPNQLYIILDYVKGISLQELAKQRSRQRFKMSETRKIFKQVAEAVHYMHSKNICHRDLKLDNILLEEDTKMVKLIDYGFSVVVNGNRGHLKIFCGTPSYMAPEIVRKDESYEGKPVDVWALGVLLYVMLCGSLPFKAPTEPELFDKIRLGHYLDTIDVLEQSTSAKHLLSRLLSTDSASRIKVEELVDTYFVKCDDLKLTIYEMAPTLSRQFKAA